MCVFLYLSFCFTIRTPSLDFLFLFSYRTRSALPRLLSRSVHVYNPLVWPLGQTSNHITINAILARSPRPLACRNTVYDPQCRWGHAGLSRTACLTVTQEARAEPPRLLDPELEPETGDFSSISKMSRRGTLQYPKHNFGTGR